MPIKLVGHGRERALCQTNRPMTTRAIEASTRESSAKRWRGRSRAWQSTTRVRAGLAPGMSPFRSCGPRGPERGSDRPRRARGPRNAGKSASRPRCSWRTQSRALMTDHSLLNATDRRCRIRAAVTPARQLLRWTRRPADGRRCAHACGRMRAHPSRTGRSRPSRRIEALRSHERLWGSPMKVSVG
jgi:hypothetical protein